MTTCITLLASEWKPSKGGLSTINRELAIQLAKLSNTSVSFFVPKCSDQDKREASHYNVKIVEAEERPGYDPIDWLTTPPEDLVINFVVGHGVILGKQAQFIRRSHQCKWIQVVHTAPDELAVYKEYSGAIPKGDEKQWTEVRLCKMADLVVAVGPKLTEFYTALLNSCGKKVYNFTPGIFDQFSSLNVSSIKGKMFRILVFGRGDTEDFRLKGYDIAANAVAKLDDKTYHLTFVGASKGSECHVTEKLLNHGLLQSQVIVKRFLENREDLITLLCSSNLVITPSRTEGFGLTALEALSAGVPFLVSQNSGFGEALQETVKDIPVGSTFIVDSEDPEHWAEAIKAVRQKGSEKAFQECQELRKLYGNKHSWRTECDEFLSVMKSLISEDDSNYKEQASEYQLPRHEPNDSTPLTAAAAMSGARSEVRDLMRGSTEERDERPNKEVPEERTAAQIRPSSQGVRSKKRHLAIATAIIDLAILGCSVPERTIYAVMQEIDCICPILNLHAQPLVKNHSPYQVKQYLEGNSLRSCVLVVDAETVKDAYENLPARGDEYKDLLQTAVEKVANKVIILLCGTPLLEKAEELVYQNLYGTVKENEKGFIAWVKDGRLSVDTDILAQLLNPALATTTGHSTKKCSTPNQCSHSTVCTE